MDCEHAEVPWCLRCKAFIKVDRAFNCSEAFFLFVIIIKENRDIQNGAQKATQLPSLGNIQLG